MSAPTRRSYDRVAERYEREIGDELVAKPFDRALLAAVAELAGQARGPLVDVGGGPGHVADHLTGLGADVLATDLSPAMCALAGRRGLTAAAADMTALPFRDGSLGAIVCLYAVIHLDADQRAAAYREFRRVLRPGGVALVSFHTGDADLPTGGERQFETWWDEPVELTFRFLDPDAEVAATAAAGLDLTARLDRAPGPGEHASTRTYLVVRRPE